MPLNVSLSMFLHSFLPPLHVSPSQSWSLFRSNSSSNSASALLTSRPPMHMIVPTRIRADALHPHQFPHGFLVPMRTVYNRELLGAESPTSSLARSRRILRRIFPDCVISALVPVPPKAHDGLSWDCAGEREGAFEIPLQRGGNRGRVASQQG